MRRLLAFAFTLLLVAHAAAYSQYDSVGIADLPKEARATLQLIKAGGPFPHERDGITFGNREARLPRRDRAYYREYTVKAPGRRDRGARRIVAGRPGEYYYSDDHYQSFRRILE